MDTVESRIGRAVETTVDRRRFLAGAAATAALGLTSRYAAAEEPAAALPPARFSFGLVTYQWGAAWDLPTLIERCAAAGLASVELRTTHKHGVEPTLTAAQRKDVARRFADSPVKLISLGSDYRFDSPDPKTLHQ